jgi:arylsulfatase
MKFQWQLYDLTKDYSQSRNVAARYPEKLAELQSGFDVAARKYHVYPLKSDVFSRLAPGLKPDILEGRSRFTYYPGETRYPSSAFPFVRPQWSMTAHVETAHAQASGPVMVQGDQFGGMGLLLEGGRPAFLYNPTGREEERLLLRAVAPMPSGSHDVQVRFASKPGAPRAATLVLSIDGQSVATADVPNLYRPRGDAYIGRRGIGTLLPDLPVGELTGARVRSIDVAISDNP